MTRCCQTCAGLRCCSLVMAVTIGLGFGTNLLRLGWLYDNYVSLMTAAILLSFLVSVLVYLSSFRMGRLLSKSGHTGCGPGCGTRSMYRALHSMVAPCLVRCAG